MEHIIARKHGGRDESDNLAWSCIFCFHIPLLLVLVVLLVIDLLSFGGRVMRRTRKKGIDYEDDDENEDEQTTSSGHQLVTNAMHGHQMLRLIPIIAKFFSQLYDDLVESARRAIIVVPPDVIQQTVA